jgi:hypothetical protein
MHWRRTPSRANGTVFYFVVTALGATVAVTTAVLVLRHHV